MSDAAAPARTKGADRRIVDDPCSRVAAWVLAAPGQRPLLVVNGLVAEMPGGHEYVEAWCRLTLGRGRHFGVLLLAQVAAAAHYLVGHQFPLG